MPCPSWGISAKRCQTGSKLRKIPGTPCSKCYALNGHYRRANVQAVQEKRYQGLLHPEWEESMVTQILLHGNTHFRWFDSGDLQSADHFAKIKRVAWQTPSVKHWMPTMEYRWVAREAYRFPPNLTVRLSSTKIGAMRRTEKMPTSMVMPVKDDAEWLELVQRSGVAHFGMFFCPSSLQDDKCMGCRACWDPKIQTIVYRQH